MILIKGVDRLDIFLSTDEIKQLNEKMNDVEEHINELGRKIL